MKKIDKWEEDNIVFSCPKHGKETYFTIKKIEAQRKMRGHVYVWFKHKDKELRKTRQEKMWVRITQGDQKSGTGTLDNKPMILKYMHYKQLIKFKTNKEGVTYGQPIHQ